MSTASSELSQASTKIDGDAVAPNDQKSSTRQTLHQVAESTTAQDILLFLIAFRILNALSVRTFFQPDEFFQSLEPAWQMVFGENNRAWITWEWRHHLRSAIHPAIFAGVYYVADILSEALRLSPLARAELLIAAPKVLQAWFAALGDYYTWKLAERIYGGGSNEAWGVLALTVLSPWQWFCSTRTLSNCLETTLTIIALYLWPWQWSLNPGNDDTTDENGLRTDSDAENEGDELARLRRCLLLAALACVLRPTNLLIWLCLVAFTVFQATTGGWLFHFRDNPIWIHFTTFGFLRATKREKLALFREAVVCGSVILALAVLIDRIYFQTWTFPPFRFLYFNIAQSLAIFYGKNDWHYYLSQGYPLLLTTALPFTIVGLCCSFFPSPSSASTPLVERINWQLASISLIVPAILSLISHKEVRFIYPLLPALHILTIPPLLAFFLPALLPTRPRTPVLLKRFLLILLIMLNFFIALYTTLIHAPAPLTVLSYLRDEHAKHYLNPPPPSSALSFAPPHSQIMTVAFLTPCHSTPWRSHLVFPTIHSWALSCEPPIDMDAQAKATYLDEADRFYADPVSFLRETMVGRPPRAVGMRLLPQQQHQQRRRGNTLIPIPGNGGIGVYDYGGGPALAGLRREWPDYVVFFEQLEPTMHVLLRGSGYHECWRGWNTRWHDDWRRRGDMLVWCLRPLDDEQKKRIEARKGIMGGNAKKSGESSWWRWPSWATVDRERKSESGSKSWLDWRPRSSDTRKRSEGEGEKWLDWRPWSSDKGKGKKKKSRITGLWT